MGHLEEDQTSEKQTKCQRQQWLEEVSIIRVSSWDPEHFLESSKWWKTAKKTRSAAQPEIWWSLPLQSLLAIRTELYLSRWKTIVEAQLYFLQTIFQLCFEVHRSVVKTWKSSGKIVHNNNIIWHLTWQRVRQSLRLTDDNGMLENLRCYRLTTFINFICH